MYKYDIVFLGSVCVAHENIYSPLFVDEVVVPCVIYLEDSFEWSYRTSCAIQHYSSGYGKHGVACPSTLLRSEAVVCRVVPALLVEQ